MKKFIQQLVIDIQSYLSLDKGTYLFTDIISNERVMSFTDRFGKKWMKESRWSLFRVEVIEDSDLEEMCKFCESLSPRNRINTCINQNQENTSML